MSAILSVRGIVLRFGGVTAVDGVSFDVPDRSIFGLIGPNGSGKTSLFNVISGFYRPGAGEVTFEGRRLTGLRPHSIARSGLARTFQTAALQLERSVLDNVLLGCYCGRADLWRDLISQRRTRSDVRRVDEALDMLGLSAIRDEPTRNLPIGIRHTVELARALMSSPRMLLLDEAWAGLNSAEAIDLVATVRRIRDTGITVLLVEHNMKVVMSLCERIVVLDAGREIAQGTPAEVRSDPRVVQSYLGTDDEEGDAGD